MIVQTHEIKLYRNVATGLHKAVCSCGWVVFGALQRVSEVAATHDRDWQAIDAADTAPAVAPWR